MTIADDCTPKDCLEIVSAEIGENAILLSKNLPKDNDTQEELAKKYAKIERYINQIRDYAKEGLKARRYGSDSVAVILTTSAKHRDLQDFSEEEKSTQVTITGPDGKSFQADMECLDRACKLAEDPATVRKILGEGE